MTRLVIVKRIGWRWYLWLAVVGLLALLALMPLRLALGLTDVEKMGFTARQVAGTIWGGRLGDLHLGDRPLGSFDVALDPLPLLTGSASMKFRRLDGLEGPLDGRLLAGSRRGIVGATGRVAVGEMFAPIPLTALDLTDVTLLFRDDTCVEASGSVVPVITIPVAGINLASGLRGTLTCDGRRARVTMVGGSGAERVEFYLTADGGYRGWMSVRGAAPDAQVALQLFGFRPTANGLTLSVDGQL
ncbi:type II secretion system protein N [Sphingomonas sp. LY160]|uniref:type II secretion system protein N n=1 Tax=Sphingomonas sp. LY160 TaxID=3095342 RepID=UPI002ADED72C|nr:type II secretion system protein N [Sphingomonas sp. LY160]MEA1072880.1 type II secretion system protein N [Sphingomonas sp. LY160]